TFMMYSFTTSILISFNMIIFFFFNDTVTIEIYTLSLHDALPILFLLAADDGEDDFRILRCHSHSSPHGNGQESSVCTSGVRNTEDRKSTRLNSSHVAISYAVFCLKKKK